MVIDAAFLEKMVGRIHRSQTVVVCHLYSISRLNIFDDIPFQYEDIVARRIGCSAVWQMGHLELLRYWYQSLRLIAYCRRILRS